MRRVPFWSYDPWEKDRDMIANFWRNMNKRAWLAWLTGIGIVGGSFIDGKPDHWPLWLEPWWVTATAGFLALAEFYGAQEKDKLNSRIAELVERLKNHESEDKE